MLRLIVTMLSLLSILSCAPIQKHTLDFNPSEPLRVAVMPFAHVNEAGEFIDEDGRLLIDGFDLKKDKRPTTFLRKVVQEELSRTALDVISPGLVNSNLSHNGLVKQEDLSFDLPRIFATDPHEICSKLFSCDAVLYGKVTRWNRDYYALQSINAVGLELKIVSAKTRKEIFFSRAEDVDSRGLSKGPTGFSDLVIEPLKGLDSKIIEDLSRSLVKKMIEPLNIGLRPEYLTSSPPGIFASSHDSINGQLTRSEPLTVLILGTPKHTATFSIGDKIENIPMSERGAGHYIGEYHALPTDKFTNESITVSLTDDFGRITSQKIGKGAVTLN